MAELYEKYKVWLPWRWLPIALFLAIMYAARGIFYVREAIQAGQEALAARKPAPTLAPAAGIPATVTGVETEIAKARPIEVKVFASRLPATAEAEKVAEEAGEKEEAKVRARRL